MQSSSQSYPPRARLFSSLKAPGPLQSASQGGSLERTLPDTSAALAEFDKPAPKRYPGHGPAVRAENRCPAVHASGRRPAQASPWIVSHHPVDPHSAASPQTRRVCDRSSRPARNSSRALRTHASRLVYAAGLEGLICPWAGTISLEACTPLHLKGQPQIVRLPRGNPAPRQAARMRRTSALRLAAQSITCPTDGCPARPCPRQHRASFPRHATRWDLTASLRSYHSAWGFEERCARRY